jgi:hypothetical protein
MKKIFLALIFFITPIISNSQTFNELKIIKNVNDFKKVMIENNFQNYDGNGENKELKESKELIVYSKIEGKYGGGEKYTMYYDNLSGAGRKFLFNWILTFNKVTKTDINAEGKLIKEYGDYTDIVESIKKECKYSEIQNIMDVDYVCYVCENNKKFGFVIDKNNKANIINLFQ